MDLQPLYEVKERLERAAHENEHYLLELLKEKAPGAGEKGSE